MGPLGWVLVAGLFAVAASGTSVLAPLRHGRPDRVAMLVFAGVVVGAGLVTAVLVTVVAHLVLRTRPGGQRWSATLRVAVPVMVVALALLALVGIARTGMAPAVPRAAAPSRSPTPSPYVSGRAAQAGGTLAYPQGSARVGDFDHDGTPDIGVDLDGDGRVDAIVVRGSDSTARVGRGRMYLERRDGHWVGAVDQDGDGVIDGYVDLDEDGDGRIDAGPGMSRADVDRWLQTLPELPAGATPPPVESSGPAPAAATPDAPKPTKRSAFAGLDLAALGPVLAVLLGVVVLALLVGGGVLVARSMRWGPRRAVPPAEPDELAQAREAMAVTVVHSIDAMLADPDPRTAVIGAYARLLEGLAACGLARYEHEAPMEHLRRVLSDLRVRPEPLRALTELFERARFSPHPLTDADRNVALAALRKAATDLAAVAPTGAA